MNSKLILYCFVGLALLLWTGAAFGQSAAATAPASPQYAVQGSVASAAPSPQAAVSYASVTQLNGLLAELEATSKTTQADLMKLRIDRWKTDGGSKKQALGNVDSIQRNLQNALPAIIAQLRSAPEDMTATFKLYRNLDALYDVLGSVVESTGAFGSKDDLQALSTDLNNFEATRKQVAERLENLAVSKEQEIVRLRADLKTAQAAVPVEPPKKIVVDDNEPAKKPPVKKKPVAKKPAATTTPASHAARPRQHSQAAVGEPRRRASGVREFPVSRCESIVRKPRAGRRTPNLLPFSASMQAENLA